MYAREIDEKPEIQISPELTPETSPTHRRRRNGVFHRINPFLGTDLDLGEAGLSQSQIDSIPEINFEIDSRIDCVICMSQVENSASIRQLPCDHIYHTECIDQWLLVNKKCPICRKPTV